MWEARKLHHAISWNDIVWNHMNTLVLAGTIRYVKTSANNLRNILTQSCSQLTMVVLSENWNPRRTSLLRRAWFRPTALDSTWSPSSAWHSAKLHGSVSVPRAGECQSDWERHSAASPQSMARLGKGSVLVQSTNFCWALVLAPGPPSDILASLSWYCEVSTSILTL